MDQIKQANMGVIYRLIDQAGPLSRIDLSRLAQLAPASITKLVREMLRVGLVKETAIGDSGNRGRPAVGVTLATCSWHYLAVRIARGRICLALYDMAYQARETASYTLSPENNQPLEALIIRQVRRFCQQYARWRLIAISVILPGVVDSESGIVRRMAFYPVRDMPLGALLAQATGLPVFIQHDISAWVMMETLSGAARGARDVVQLVIHDQVAASVVTEGRLLHAGSSSLVEIGHMWMRPQGRLCQCGHQGCLESLISTDSVLTRLRHLQSQQNSLSDQQPLTVEHLCDAALQGDTLACQLINEVAGYAGQALALLVNIFNPQKILIGSPFNRAATILFPAIIETIRQQALPAYSQRITVESTHFSCFDTVAASARVKDAMYDGSLITRVLSQRLLSGS